MLFVWSVHFSVWMNQVNCFGMFAICMNPLEYMGKDTQSVKDKFQVSWESGE